jgi:hypothetical protein
MIMSGDVDSFARKREEKKDSASSWKSATHPEPSQRRRRRDRDEVPDGFDANVWELAMFFEHQAYLKRSDLATGRYLIYSKLADKFEKSKIRQTKSFQNKAVNWVSMVKVMMMDFWDYMVDDSAYAIDQFCGPEMFHDLMMSAVSSQETQRLSKGMDARPRGEHAVNLAAGTRRPLRRQEEVAPAPPRDRPRRSWDEVSARLKQISAKRSGE